MTLSLHELGLEVLDALEPLDALCLFVAEEDRPLTGSAGDVDWRLCGSLSRVLKDGFFQGAAGDCLLLPSEGRLSMPRIFVIGLGQRQALDVARLREAFKAAAHVLVKAKMESVALELPAGGALSEAERLAVLKEDFVPAFGARRVAVLAEKGLMRAPSSGNGN